MPKFGCRTHPLEWKTFPIVGEKDWEEVPGTSLLEQRICIPLDELAATIMGFSAIPDDGGGVACTLHDIRELPDDQGTVAMLYTGGVLNKALVTGFLMTDKQVHNLQIWLAYLEARKIILRIHQEELQRLEDNFRQTVGIPAKTATKK